MALAYEAFFLGRIQQTDDAASGPHMVGDPAFHRWRDAQRL
jgi:hypothetical protein